MTWARIGDLVLVTGGGTPRRSEPRYYNGDIPWVTPKDMKRHQIGSSEVALSEEGVANSPARLIDAGSTLVVVRSGVLKHTLPVAIATRAVTVNQDMKALTPRDGQVDPSYLARLVKAQEPRVLRSVRATTADNFPIEDLLGIEIPLPPLPEQRRIAAILDEADAVAGHAHRAIEALLDLENAVVDEAISSAERAASLSSLGMSLSSGLSVGDGGLEAHPFNRILKVSAVSRGEFLGTEIKPMPLSYSPPRSHEVRAGDLLMTRASGSIELIARSTFVSEVAPDVFLPDKIWRVELNPSSPLTLRYIDGLTRHPRFRTFIRNSSSGASGVRNISQAKVLDFVAPVPSPDAMAGLERRLAETMEWRASAKSRARAIDALFASLQHRAFRGEL